MSPTFLLCTITHQSVAANFSIDAEKRNSSKYKQKEKEMKGVLIDFVPCNWRLRRHKGERDRL